mmetsp:Transcript_9894/g.40048  ORF Transcript_9894/g.40048 Transcript_9894/m.40048 type:complete len:298 (-) Transcript_9894:980-1873(-)
MCVADILDGASNASTEFAAPSDVASSSLETVLETDVDANATAAAALSAAVTGGILAPAAPAASRALSGAVAAILAKPLRVSSPALESRDATTSAPTSSCSSLSTWTTAASRSARAAMASSSATFALSETAASSDRAAASASSAPSALCLSARTSSSCPSFSNAEAPIAVDGSTTAASCWTSRFTTGLFRIFLALAAYLSVLRVSSRLASAGDMHAIMHVRELPPSESCSSRVSLESRYGTCRCRGPRSCFRRSWSSAMALITLPRASRPLLMLMDSLNLCPDAPVRLFRSEPARSTR